jgi:LmbE family N-acetylglucosaminyl deacetylase
MKPIVDLSSIRKILCLGAHADDIEIGCGGTILRLTHEIPELHVTWVVTSASGHRRQEAERSAAAFLSGSRSSEVRILDYEDGFLPTAWSSLKQMFFELRDVVTPDLIFTHRLEDRHQDHRTLAELTWNTFRDHTLLEYEIPKYEGDLGANNFFVTLSPDVCDRKMRLLLDGFPSQSVKPWFREETFRAMLSLRGVESNSASHLAEAFLARKLVV